MRTPEVLWTNTARAQIREIYNYYKYQKQTLSGARNVVSDIFRAGREIRFSEQYQKDEIQPEYRRIIVRHYKLLYTLRENKVIILRVFNTYQNPQKQLEENKE